MTQNQTFHYIDIVEEVTDACNHRSQNETRGCDKRK